VLVTGPASPLIKSIQQEHRLKVCATLGAFLLDPIYPAIEFRDVTLAFDDFVVLDRVSFQVAHGETKVVLALWRGKSTVLKIVLGLLKPDRATC